MQKIVFLGATKGMGRALSRLQAEQGARLFLLGRDAEELERSAADLAIRAGAEPVAYHPCNLTDIGSFGPALDAAEAHLGNFDTVVVSAGAFAKQEELEENPSRLAELLQTNFTGTVLFCEEARKRLLKRGGGTLAVFSSVAGERGRKPVVLYGASKAGLSRYLEGLDHRYRSDGLRVVCVKPGFVKTTMTQGLKPPPFAGNPEQVAKRVDHAIRRGVPVVYAPGVWGLIMWVIRQLPRPLMRRLSF